MIMSRAVLHRRESKWEELVIHQISCVLVFPILLCLLGSPNGPSASSIGSAKGTSSKSNILSSIFRSKVKCGIDTIWLL